MCGRYTNAASLSDVRRTFQIAQLELFREWTPTYNITPSHGPGFEQLMVVQTRDGVRRLRLGRFWMIPEAWPKPLNELPTSFNARAEDLARKPFWRSAYRSARCLVPATGWREFTGPAGHKQPHHFHLDHALFAFAGLWSRFTSPEGEVADTFAIVTTEPNAVAAKYHDRMPLVMPREHWDAWLDTSVDPEPVLRAARGASRELVVRVYASDPIGNSGRYEGALAIAPYPRDEPVEPVQTSLFPDASPPGPTKRRR